MTPIQALVARKAKVLIGSLAVIKTVDEKIQEHFIDRHASTPAYVEIRNTYEYSSQDLIEAVINHFTTQGWVITNDKKTNIYCISMPG